MKIMSFNTQHCQSFVEQKIDFNIMADAIKKCDADIVCALFIGYFDKSAFPYGIFPPTSIAFAK